MEEDTGHGRNGQRGSKNESTSAQALAILQRYSHGDISDWEAAELLGKDYSQHDVFALIRKHKMALPLPPQAELDRQKAALELIFGKAKRH